MAFIKDQTGVAQTAANVAATIVAAFVDKFESFGDAVEAFNDLREATFKELAVIVDADNAKFAAEDKGNGNGRSETKSYSKPYESKKTGGGNKGKGNGSVSLESAKSLELNFGAFRGETLEDVLGYDAGQCDDDFSYGDGKRDGRDYVSWLASDKNQNEYVRARAILVAADAGIES